MKGTPCSSSPRSSTSTTFSWRTRFAALASRRKRLATSGSRACCSWSTLMATVRPMRTLVAWYTSPMPPEPSFFSSLYLPARVCPSRVAEGGGSTEAEYPCPLAGEERFRARANDAPSDFAVAGLHLAHEAASSSPAAVGDLRDALLGEQGFRRRKAIIQRRAAIIRRNAR